MQAITTKHLSPTNLRGSRIKATACSGISHTISYPYELNSDKAHMIAALELVRKLNWTNGKPWYGGSTKDGFVFVCPTESLTFSVKEQE